MEGACLGDFIADHFKERLLKLKLKPKHGPDGAFYGLSFIDPKFDAGKVRVKTAPCFGTDGDVGKTVEELEKEGKSLGLERFQAFVYGTSKFSTRKHRVPSIDGACGIDSVKRIMKAIKLDMVRVDTRPPVFQLIDTKRVRRVLNPPTP